jgi:Ser/Thr protein kinase RdoA (MazF antagonist)
MREPVYSEPEPVSPELPLTGGDVTAGVARVGDTVRRPTGPYSPAVHAFLRHLEAAGFEGAPRFLGIDGKGREVLSFIAGEVAGKPRPAWVLDDSALHGVGTLLRRLHESAADFALPAGVAWPPPFDIPGVPLPFDAPDIVGHNDVTMDNVVFRAGAPVTFIDFDLAGPTTRLHDLVATMRYWAPLSPPEDREPGQRGLDAGHRMRLMADAYGLDTAERSLLLDIADRRFARIWHTMRYRAENFGGGWARMWNEGVGDRILRARDWLRGEHERLRDALR